MAGANGSVVLVVDDEPAVRKLLMEILTRAGFACVGAADGESGLSLAARHPVSTAVVAFQLPGMDGLELAWRLHVQRPALCVVGLSDYADLWDADGLRGLGIRRVLSVPFGPEELLRAICLSAAALRPAQDGGAEPVEGAAAQAGDGRARTVSPAGTAVLDTAPLSHRVMSASPEDPPVSLGEPGPASRRESGASSSVVRTLQAAYPKAADITSGVSNGRRHYKRRPQQPPTLQAAYPKAAADRADRPDAQRRRLRRVPLKAGLVKNGPFEAGLMMSPTVEGGPCNAPGNLPEGARRYAAAARGESGGSGSTALPTQGRRYEGLGRKRDGGCHAAH